MGKKEDESKERRRRLLRRAFGSLGTLPARAIPEPSHPAAAPEPPTFTAAPIAAPTSEMSAFDREYAKKIDTKAALLGKDHFAILEVPRNATREQVKSAYLSAVKTFHPDHIPPSLGHLAGRVKEIFNAIREAHVAIEDDVGRALYLAELEMQKSDSATRKAPANDVEICEREAELHLRKRDYSLAAEEYAKAFALGKNPSHLAQEAWAIYVDPQRKADLPLVIMKLEQALTLDAKNEKACYAMGVIARVQDDLLKATKFFKTAVATNPRNAEAIAELRLIEMRSKMK